MQWARKQTPGFTIVELIIVVVVIAILAAVVIVGYNGVTQKARATAVQNAVQQANDTIATTTLHNGGTIPSDLASAGVSNGNGITYQYSVNTASNPAGYCITASGNGVSYYMANYYTYTGATTTTLSQTSPAAGACPGHGVNGVAAVTNMLTNPNFDLGVTTGWVGTNATISLSTAQAHSGTNSLKVVTNGSVAAEGVIAVVPSPGTMPGNTYSDGIWVWAPTGSTLYLVTRTSGAAAQDSAQTIITGNNTWQFYTANNKLAQSDATSLQIHVRTKSVQSTTFYVDDGIVIQGTQVTGYGDGNTPNWVWNGAPNASTSTGPAS